MITIGQVFSRLTVIELRVKLNSYRVVYHRVRCSCGKVFDVRGTSLTAGVTMSCGCLHRAMIGDIHRQHGHSGHNISRSPTYITWNAVKQRCLNPKATGYSQYGGKGILVCSRWLESFENFLSDMGERPGLDYSIDRIDPDGNYEPANCRWITKSENTIRALKSRKKK